MSPNAVSDSTLGAFVHVPDSTDRMLHRPRSVVPAARWEDAQQHGVGLVPGLVAMLPHAPLIADGSGITIAGEVRSFKMRRGSEMTRSRGTPA